MLTNGKVLVAGGLGNSTSYLSSAELYNSSTGIWTITVSMNYSRYLHTASVLTTGKVLVTGVYGSSGNYLNTSELYQP